MPLKLWTRTGVARWQRTLAPASDAAGAVADGTGVRWPACAGNVAADFPRGMRREAAAADCGGNGLRRIAEQSRPGSHGGRRRAIIGANARHRYHVEAVDCGVR